MGTIEVYEEKLRLGNLYHHDPTMNPGLGSPRCPHCLSLIDSNYVGCGIGGLLGAIHSFNTGMPYVQKHVKGPKWLPFFIGVPSLLTLSAGTTLFGGYTLPKFTQLTVTSYYAASSASHYGISLLTRHIEDSHISRSQKHSDDQLHLRKL